MSSTSLSSTSLSSTLYPAPPPTSNNLDPYSRARLVRSTRKLEAILGTTPHLQEPDVEQYSPYPPTSVTYRPDTPESQYQTKRARRHASVFSIFPTSTHSGYSSSTTSLSSSSSHSICSLTSSSSSSSTNSSVTSLTLDAFESEETPILDEHRSLPIPKSFSSKPRRARDSARPRPLVLRLNARPVAPSDPRLPMSPLSPNPSSEEDVMLTPLAPVFPTAEQLRRKKMAKLTRTLGENVPPELVFATQVPQHIQQQPTYAVPDAPTTPRARTNLPLAPLPRTSSRRRANKTPAASVDETTTQRLWYSEQPRMYVEEERPSSQIWVTGTNVWRGEWNRRDIRDVQAGLRNLKGR